MLSHNSGQNISVWKTKRLIKELQSCQGSGTSVISLIIPPGEQVSRYSKMLDEELGTAAHIKSRMNRQSVQEAITSTKNLLRSYNKVPDNGLIIYCGQVSVQGAKERKVKYNFEPFKPINKSLYLCHSKFHTEVLEELLKADDYFGFIVMDGSGTLFGTLNGDHKKVLQKMSIEIPKKHGRGGQSAQRFGRIRMEKRHNYVRKVAETALNHFITDEKPNIQGLVLAGSGEFKNQLNRSDLFDPRLTKIVLNTVDISYGGDAGFAQAIEKSADQLASVKYVAEKNLLAGFFKHISKDTGMFTYGVERVLAALEMSAVKTIILYEALPLMRYTIKLGSSKNSETNEDETEVVFVTPKPDIPLVHPKTKEPMEIIESEYFSEWLAENYSKYGAELYFVSNRSEEGSQFIRGFGGIGAILHWKLDQSTLLGDVTESDTDSDTDDESEEYDDESEFDSEDDFM